MIMGAGRGKTPDAYAKRVPLTSGVPGPCFRCHGDHWIRDCPYEIADKGGAREPAWPRVPRHCIACGIDHLAKDCPSKPATSVLPPKTTLNLVERLSIQTSN